VLASAYSGGKHADSIWEVRESAACGGVGKRERERERRTRWQGEREGGKERERRTRGARLRENSRGGTSLRQGGLGGRVTEVAGGVRKGGRGWGRGGSAPAIEPLWGLQKQPPSPSGFHQAQLMLRLAKSGHTWELNQPLCPALLSGLRLGLTAVRRGRAEAFYPIGRLTSLIEAKQPHRGGWSHKASLRPRANTCVSARRWREAY
jgi:hypothetical protein